MVRYRAGEMNDAELGMENLKNAMSDKSLMSEVAEELRHPESAAALVELMANPKFREQAKPIA
jgi:hypothetical protein